MRLDPAALLAIAGMALVTYATRAGGFWLLGRISPSPRLEAWLGYLPGTVLIAVAAPTVASNGLAGALATAATVLVAWRSRNVFLAAFVGVLAIWVVRLL